MSHCSATCTTQLQRKVIMQIIQTLAIGKQKCPYKDSFGWLTPEHHLMAWSFSCLQLRSLGYDLILHGDSCAAEILSTKLKLPFSKIQITHESFILPDPQLWALSKIYTYGLQSEPFIHIDGDVFLFERFPEAFCEAPLIAQNTEEATEFYTSAQAELMKHLDYFPREVKNDFWSGDPITAVNAGILGGSDIEFFQEYSAEALRYVAKNTHCFDKVPLHQFNVFFEQHLFYTMAKSRGIKIEYLLAESFRDNFYTGLANFHQTPQRRKYLHLLGHFKRDKFACQEMASHFRALYPEYYYQVLDCCKTNATPLHFSYYLTEQNCNSWADYKAVCAKADNSFELNSDRAPAALQSYPDLRINSENMDTGNESCRIDYKIISDQIEELLSESDDKSLVWNDLYLHQQTTVQYQRVCNSLDDSWALGRDMHSTTWWSDLFGNKRPLNELQVCAVPYNYVLKTKFDWGARLYGLEAEGRPFHTQRAFENGEYFTNAGRL